VQEEATKELHGRELHRLPGIAVVIVAILEGDPLAVGGDDALVRGRDSVRLLGQICQHLLWPVERRFGVSCASRCSKREQQIEGGPIAAMYGGISSDSSSYATVTALFTSVRKRRERTFDREKEPPIGDVHPAATIEPQPFGVVESISQI
jgi:hypothetical protein